MTARANSEIVTIMGGYLSEDSPRFAQLLDGISMVGGILIVLFGIALLQASLVTARHPLL